MALVTLPVRGRAPKTGYDRAQFGPDWFDADGNGCNTRNDVLAAVLTDLVRDGACEVLGGVLFDRYGGDTVLYAPTRPSAVPVEVDHVVALGDAWQKGAQQLDYPTRVQFANDPLNLVATAAVWNRQKGDGDTATWLPHNRPYWCEYVATQIAVKVRYRLWVTAAEAAAMRAVLSACPGQDLPDSPEPPRPTGLEPPQSSPATTTPPGPPTSTPPVSPPPARPTSGPGIDRPYENCAQARAAGDAPLYRGEPGYSPDLDGDSDGIACET